MIFRELTNEEFETFASSHPYQNFVQSSYTRNVNQALGEQTYLFGVIVEGCIVAATYLIRRPIAKLFSKFYAPNGFLMDYSNIEVLQFFTKNLASFSKKNNGVLLRIDPFVVVEEYDVQEERIEIQEGVIATENLKAMGYQHLGYIKGYGKSEQSRWHYVLDLKNHTKESYFKNCKSNTRNRINTSHRFYTKVRIGSEQDLQQFYDIILHTGERQGFGSRSLAYYKTFYSTFVKENKVKLLFAEINLVEYGNVLEDDLRKIKVKLEKAIQKEAKQSVIDECHKSITSFEKRLLENKERIAIEGNIVTTACAMFVKYGNQVTYYTSGGYESLMNYNGQYFLQDYMIKEAIDEGYETYNFFGITGNFERDGVYEFKKGFQGKAIGYIGQFDYICNKMLYNILKSRIG